MTTASRRIVLVLTALTLPLVLAAADNPPAAPNNAAAPAKPLTKSQAAFEKLKSLAGDWEGKSTKGWTEKVTYAVISGGSVVMELSYGAHPEEWMATMFHLDGDNLMLTHYCVAKNQPRLKATKIADDLSTITFEFQDATNLKSRDQGHMDKLVLTMTDPNHFTAHWTWYQNGKEDWMEKIEHRRAAADPSAPTAQPANFNPVLCRQAPVPTSAPAEAGHQKP
jgi:hypothetical protein